MEYVSLREVLDSVSKQVPIPEDWEKILPLSHIPNLPLTGRYKNQTEDFRASLHKLRLSAINDLFQSAYRCSQAAPVLDQYLHNAAPGGPKWLDWGETGRPKISDSARSEGLRMLVHMSGYFARCLEDFQIGRYEKYPHHGIPLYEGMFKNSNDVDRIQQIVFYREEIIEFLDDIGIPHSLGALAFPANEAKTSSKEEKNHTTSNVSVKSTAAKKPAVTVHRTSMPADHKLRRCIDDARGEVANRDDTQAVWSKLVDMAIGKNRARPSEMINFVDGKGIAFLGPEKIEYFTKRLLGKQFSNERRKLVLAKSPPVDPPL